MKKIIMITMMIIAVVVLSTSIASSATTYLDFGYFEATNATFADEITTSVAGTAATWIASATAGTTLTTIAGVTGSITGNFAGGNIWEASYSTNNGATWNVFTDILPGFGQTGFQTQVTDAQFINQPIIASITDIKLAYDFTLLNAGAAGTANFEVTPEIPEPSSIILALTGLTSIAGIVFKYRA